MGITSSALRRLKSSHFKVCMYCCVCVWEYCLLCKKRIVISIETFVYYKDLIVPFVAKQSEPLYVFQKDPCGCNKFCRKHSENSTKVYKCFYPRNMGSSRNTFDNIVFLLVCLGFFFLIITCILFKSPARFSLWKTEIPTFLFLDIQYFHFRSSVNINCPALCMQIVITGNTFCFFLNSKHQHSQEHHDCTLHLVVVCMSQNLPRYLNVLHKI